MTAGEEAAGAVTGRISVMRSGRKRRMRAERAVMRRSRRTEGVGIHRRLVRCHPERARRRIAGADERRDDDEYRDRYDYERHDDRE